MSDLRSYRLLVAVLWHFAAVLALIAAPARAQTEPVPRPTNIAASLEVASPARAGETIDLVIRMNPAEGWHGYWSNPGDAGLGLTIDWTLPPGATVGELEYPVPTTLLIGGMMNHVYKGAYAVIVPLTLPADAPAGSRLPIVADAQWLACTDEVCVPEQGRLQTSIAIGNPGDNPGTIANPFAALRAKLPAPLDSDARFAVSEGAIRIAIPLPATLALGDPHLFAAQDRLIDYAAPQAFSRKGDLLIVELQRPARAAAEPDAFPAVLRLNHEGDGLSFTATPGPVPAGGEPLITGTSVSPTAGLPLLLLGALAGGLLLNLMPCVFPILSLKALSLARAGESEAQARSEGLAYTAGVVLACIGLGAVMLGLRAAGQEVGWAFQLQEPLVIAVLLVLATAITANFIGLFEFSVPGFAAGGSQRGAFATGLLAAFVATPCTGPFMAAAMGAALLLPPLPAMTLFAALGLGIALPFLAVAFVPALRRRMPKPGPWMDAFRRWMALPMGLTALALLWLASRVGGTGFALASALLAGLVLVLLTLAGRRQRTGRPVAALSTAAIALAFTGALALPQAVSTPAGAAQGVIDTRPFSEAALAEARASGKPVFAWFTADWCLTCKVNEQVAIEREATRDAFEKGGVIVLRGDWTRRDPAITRYLAAQGAAGVPLYVWYPAGGGNPEQLPQVLTQTMLTERAGG